MFAEHLLLVHACVMLSANCTQTVGSACDSRDKIPPSPSWDDIFRRISMLGSLFSSKPDLIHRSGRSTNRFFITVQALVAFKE